jgi:hypothetical protein
LRVRKYSPGTVDLAGVAIPDNATLVFGADDGHNAFALRAGDVIAYIDTPNQAPLHAVQAAALALQDIWERG